MNERLKELAEQATINVGDEFHPIDFFDKEKFARLIIQECTKKTWVELSEESALRLWQICKIPVHLDTPDSAALRYARAISFALREANHNTHLNDERTTN